MTHLLCYNMTWQRPCGVLGGAAKKRQSVDWLDTVMEWNCAQKQGIKRQTNCIVCICL